MSFLNQVEHVEHSFPRKQADPHEAVRNECGRLIHAAVISRRFQNNLLNNPLKTIEEGYCGEKFAFTHDEKQRIRTIRASNLADFSRQLMHALEPATSFATPTPEFAFAYQRAL
jgi:hypothetical protein